MATLGMNGSYPLNIESIDKAIDKVSPGNYALGHINKRGKFVVRYIGRDDKDVRDRLKQWVGKSDQPLFKFSYATSPEAAFDKECVNYHDFIPRENTHPERPDNTIWSCPRCNLYD